MRVDRRANAISRVSMREKEKERVRQRNGSTTWFVQRHTKDCTKQHKRAEREGDSE